MEYVRNTTTINLPIVSAGSRRSLVYHTYGPSNTSRAYIQASLHADELPGIILCHHLTKMLDQAAKDDAIIQEIIIVPYANPIGLAQAFNGDLHLGRFSFETNMNFNRNWFDLTEQVAKIVENKLTMDINENTKIIRNALITCINNTHVYREEEIMKKELYKLACTSDVVLDLHCDCESLIYMFTHGKCWPAFKDLCIELQTVAQLLADDSGGNSFDEAYTKVWDGLMTKFPDYPIAMGCHSSTVELRGQADVTDEYGLQDASAIFRWLQGRGYMKPEYICNIVAPRISNHLLNDATPLTGMDDGKVECEFGGVIVWKVKLGDWVNEGQIIGEIVNIEEIDAPRIIMRAKTDGLVFSFATNKLVRPGQTMYYIAGKEPLEHRKGNLLSL